MRALSRPMKTRLSRVGGGSAWRHAARWALCVALAGCSNPYKPTLHLEETRQTIPATVFQEPLRDLSPPDDREASSSHSVAVTSHDRVDGPLPRLIEQAIRADFSATSVFRYFSSERERADLVMSGTIYRFYGEVTMPRWQVIPGLNLFLQAVTGSGEEWSGEVDLELRLSRPDGRQLGAYRGRVRFHEAASATASAWSAPLYPAHARLNRAFTEALHQIRDQMYGDRELLLAAIKP